MFMGYEPGSKACRVYDPDTGRLQVTRDAVFNEGRSWNCEAPLRGVPDTFTVEYMVTKGDGDAGKMTPTPLTAQSGASGGGSSEISATLLSRTLR